MLADQKPLFEAHEPRNVFPVFAECENRINYAYTPLKSSTKQVMGYLYSNIKNPERYLPRRKLVSIIYKNLARKTVKFRGAFCDRDGNLITTFKPFVELSENQGFDICVNDLLKEQGLPVQDGQFLLVADASVVLSRKYSTGVITAAYLKENSVTCYRNGSYARAVNHFSHHRPRGFRSIAPHTIYNDDVETTAYFFNFSSDPTYDYTANPDMTLQRDDGKELKAKFGDIPPNGAKERGLVEIFGEEVKDFLKPSGNCGTLIAEAQGVTLGSIHLIRNRKTGTMAIEHTRPTHAYLY